MTISEKDALALAEALRPYIIRHLKNDADWRRLTKITTAQVISKNDENRTATVKYGYDEQVIENIPVEMATMPADGDYVYILYWDSLTNAHIVMKNKGR